MLTRNLKKATKLTAIIALPRKWSKLKNIINRYRWSKPIMKASKRRRDWKNHRAATPKSRKMTLTSNI